MSSLTSYAWDIVNDEHSTEKAVSNALHVVLDCYAFKRQLLMDITHIAPAIRDFVEEQREELDLRSPRAIISGSDRDSNRVF
jgi:hypothetical protein